MSRVPRSSHMSMRQLRQLRQRLLSIAWVRSLATTALVGVVLLVTTWLATAVGMDLEGRHPMPAMLFAKLRVVLQWLTLGVLPVLFVVLWCGLLDRIHHIRLKLFAAYAVGQVAAIIAAYVATLYPSANVMALEPPQDGLFTVLFVYGAVLSLALFYVLAGSMSAALGRIRAAAARIADGDLETRVDVASRDELADLAADLNAMAARLSLVAQQERRMEASRRELIAAVSHDLRTPLAAIRATIEAITDGVVTDEETIARYLHTMNAGTRELSGLIDDLFELSRIDAGALTLDPRPSSVALVVSQALEQLQPQAAGRGVDLRDEIAPDLPPALIDARYVGRVLVNLVDNAVRHTSSGGCVRVVARRDDESDTRRVRVEVIDDGEGIAAADLPRVFERFYRGEKSRSREHGGAGLGLAISKGIIEAHGGAIGATAAQPRGTCIAFTLPATRQ